jgi:hypothetical protein
MVSRLFQLCFLCLCCLMLVKSQAEEISFAIRSAFAVRFQSRRRCWISPVNHRHPSPRGYAVRWNIGTARLYKLYAWRAPKDLELKPLKCNYSREVFYFGLCGVEDWSSWGPQDLDRGLPTSAAYARAAGHLNHRCFEDTSAAAAIGFHEERILTAASKTCQVHFLCSVRHIHADSRVSDNLSTIATAGCPCRRNCRTP